FRALQGEQISDYEMVILAPNQQPRRLNATATPLYDERGEMLGALATLHDITTESLQQEEIRRQNRELTQFSRIASSDLQAPLRRIIQLSENLQNSITDVAAQPMRKDLRAITRSAEKMGVLIKDVLYMSRLPIGELSMQPVAPRECMEAAIDLSGLTEVDCRFDFRFAQAPEVLADPHSLTNVFRNLILNASRVGGDARKRHIEFTCELHGDTLVAGVKDNGGGVTAEDTERMFLPLERLHTEMDQEGTGLALAISRKSIELMGGEIWAENHGNNCHIKFRLPLAHHEAAVAS
ncbi:MAG: ATP-binding protein, partial [Pseudomonadota bacterium]